jgi:hypothetical protein
MASTAMPASALTGQGCNQTIDWQFGTGAEECTQVVGTGLRITSISGKFDNQDGATTIYIDFYGPDGHITNTGNMTVGSNGSTGWITWHNPNPNFNMTAGYYCTEAYLSDGTPIISDCIEVHT